MKGLAIRIILGPIEVQGDSNNLRILVATVQHFRCISSPSGGVDDHCAEPPNDVAHPFAVLEHLANPSEIMGLYSLFWQIQLPKGSAECHILVYWCAYTWYYFALAHFSIIKYIYISTVLQIITLSP